MSSDEKGDKFDLVFRGVLAKGVELAVAKRNMAQLFKIDEAKVEALFSGKPVTLKRGLLLDVANKYRVAIKKAGALVDVEQQKTVAAKPLGRATFGEAAPESPAAPVPQAQSTKSIGAIPGTESSAGAIPGTVDNKPEPSTIAAHVSAAEPVSTEPSPVEVNASDFGLAPVGADLLKPEEHKSVEAVEVDVSALSLKPSEGNLLEASEYKEEPELHLDLSEFDLAEAGADVLKPEERVKVQPVEVELGHLSVAEAGGNLAPPQPAPPAAPDVSGITLKEP